MKLDKSKSIGSNGKSPIAKLFIDLDIVTLKILYK
jgi:hypothetical protein